MAMDSGPRMISHCYTPEGFLTNLQRIISCPGVTLGTLCLIASLDQGLHASQLLNLIEILLE